MILHVGGSFILVLTFIRDLGSVASEAEHKVWRDPLLRKLLRKQTSRERDGNVFFLCFWNSIVGCSWVHDFASSIVSDEFTLPFNLASDDVTLAPFPSLWECFLSCQVSARGGWRLTLRSCTWSEPVGLIVHFSQSECHRTEKAGSLFACKFSRWQLGGSWGSLSQAHKGLSRCIQKWPAQPW